MGKQVKRIVVVGAGGLGCAICSSLASTLDSGAEILICDPDVVELSNLNRQIFFCENSIGEPKASCLATTLSNLYPNPAMSWHSKHTLVNVDTADELLKNCSVVVDATDSPNTKFFLNQYCVEKQIPLAHGAAAGIHGQALIIHPKAKTACLRCLFEEDLDTQNNCQQAGILGAFVGIVGMLQAEMVRKALRGEFPKLLYSFTMDPWRIKTIAAEPDPLCPVCAR